MKCALTVPLVLLLGFMWKTAVAEERITFRIPADDPNENSAVVRSVAFSSDGTLLAATYGRFIGLLQEPRPGQAIVWDAHAGVRRATLLGHKDGVSSVAFSPEGKILATGG